jgi:hypothetical protein
MQPEGRDPDGYEEPATSMMDQRRGIGGPAAPLLPHVILLCDGAPPPLLSGCDIPGRAGAVDQRRGRGRPAAPLLLNVVILYGGSYVGQRASVAVRRRIHPAGGVVVPLHPAL